MQKPNICFERDGFMKLRNMTSVYFVREGEILCLYRIGSRVVGNRYVGAAGGHFEEEELNDPRKCVLREMNEELGLTEADVENLTLRYITHRAMAGEVLWMPRSAFCPEFTVPACSPVVRLRCCPSAP